MGLFDAIDASASGLTAERMRMDVVSENLANAQTTRGVDGQPYRRKTVVLQEADTSQNGFAAALGSAMGRRANGVEVVGIAQDTAPGRRVYDPGHPDADRDGYVTMPNVNSVTEMTDLITATRAYEANTTAINAVKGEAQHALDVLR
jgi:flagellar basal-body rod protein FlgC